MSTESKPERYQGGGDVEKQAKGSLKWIIHLKQTFIAELLAQRGLVLPLTAMNLTWFAKIAITTAFLGRVGELELAGGTLGFTFANVTGFSVLTGLCGAMEPICGQAFGGQNYKLQRKTLVKTIILLLSISIPISFLWLKVDRILIHFGQQEEISMIAKTYLLYLVPDLFITSVLSPLKTYLNSQSKTLPVLISSAIAVSFHIPINIFLFKSRGIKGVSMAIWVTELIVVILLILYIAIQERKKSERWSGLWEQNMADWWHLISLGTPCCITTCLEWWCIEILMLLTGHLREARKDVSVLAVVLNFDYLLYAVMISLATSASTRVSNELGANRQEMARKSACVSIVMSMTCGFVGAGLMVACRDSWGSLFSKDVGVLKGVKKMMLLMAIIELVNFPLVVCGGVLRGTARPRLSMYANLGGFYAVALPVGVALSFRVGLGLSGLLFGFLIGSTFCLIILVIFMSKINWDEEVSKAQKLVSSTNQKKNTENIEDVHMQI